MAHRRVSVAQVRSSMKDIVDAVKTKGRRIEVTRYGRTVAYIVPAEDGRVLEECREEIEACRKRLRGRVTR